MGIVENASKNDSLERVLTGGTAWDIISVLDGICNYAVKVDGAVLYGYNGYTAYSAGVGSPPSLDQLREDEDFEKFMLSDERSLVSVRKKPPLSITTIQDITPKKELYPACIKSTAETKPSG